MILSQVSDTESRFNPNVSWNGSLRLLTVDNVLSFDANQLQSKVIGNKLLSLIHQYTELWLHAIDNSRCYPFNSSFNQSVIYAFNRPSCIGHPVVLSTQMNGLIASHGYSNGINHKSFSSKSQHPSTDKSHWFKCCWPLPIN